MCARFTLFTPAALIAEQFKLLQVPILTPRYNVAPSQPVAVIGTKASGGGRGLAMFRWGFVPSWADKPSGPRPVNAKSETVAEKPTFRDAFRERRCLVPADGFYEWQTTPEGKKPLFFHRKDRMLIAFAGIWDCWQGPSEKLFTCTILTTTANELMTPFHDRMPVILPAADWDQWLDPKVTEPARLSPLIRQFPSEELAITPANPIVNNSRVEGPECLAMSHFAASNP